MKHFSSILDDFLAFLWLYWTHHWHFYGLLHNYQIEKQLNWLRKLHFHEFDLSSFFRLQRFLGGASEIKTTASLNCYNFQNISPLKIREIFWKKFYKKSIFTWISVLKFNVIFIRTWNKIQNIPMVNQPFFDLFRKNDKQAKLIAFEQQDSATTSLSFK